MSPGDDGGLDFLEGVDFLEAPDFLDPGVADFLEAEPADFFEEADVGLDPPSILPSFSGILL